MCLLARLLACLQELGLVGLELASRSFQPTAAWLTEYVAGIRAATGAAPEGSKEAGSSDAPALLAPQV